MVSAKETAEVTVAAPENVLEQEPLEIEERAEELGSERLDRSLANILLTAIIGGGEVSLGALAAMSVVGAVIQAVPGVNLYVALAVAGLVFPLGFVFVIVGRSEQAAANAKARRLKSAACCLDSPSGSWSAGACSMARSAH